MATKLLWRQLWFYHESQAFFVVYDDDNKIENDKKSFEFSLTRLKLKQKADENETNIQRYFSPDKISDAKFGTWC